MASASVSTPGASRNSVSRIGGVLVSPKETFASIAERPTWLAPVILSCIVGLGLIGVFANRVGWQRAVERNIQNNPVAARRLDQLSPAQRAQNINVQVKIFPYIYYSSGAAGPFLFTLILASIFLALFKLGYGSEIGIKTSMGIVAYSFVPRILYALVGILVIFLKDPSEIDFQNLLASNPGALLSPDTARWLVVLLTQIDFFTFWVMILLAMGYHAANPKKVSFGGAFAGIFGLWLIWVIVLVGFTAALS